MYGNKITMSEQYIGDGASTFITIIAVIYGFAAALGYIDYLKTRKELKAREEDNEAQ